jgi:hypothetical protein
MGGGVCKVKGHASKEIAESAGNVWHVLQMHELGPFLFSSAVI